MLNRTELRQRAIDALRGLALIESARDVRDLCKISADELMYLIRLESSTVEVLEKAA